jgi:hypothetical protein
MRSIRHGVLVLAAAFVIAGLAAPVAAQTVPPPDQVEQPAGKRGEDVLERTPPFMEQWRDLRHALTRLPIAAGVGVYLLAVFATLFILGLLWIVESFEPKATQVFMLKVTAKEPDVLKPRIEKLLSQYKLAFELRGASKEDLHYEVKIPLNRKNHRLSDLIQKIDPENISAVEWEEKKEKKK